MFNILNISFYLPPQSNVNFSGFLVLYFSSALEWLKSKNYSFWTLSPTSMEDLPAEFFSLHQSLASIRCRISGWSSECFDAFPISLDHLVEDSQSTPELSWMLVFSVSFLAVLLLLS